MLDPRPLVTQPLDVIETTAFLELSRGPIYRVVRLVKNGPLCPSVIMWVTTRHEPGEVMNTMDRSPHLAAFVSGEPADWRRLFASGKAGTRHITRAEYARLLAEIAANRRAGRYDPRTKPYEAVEIDRLPIPFSKEPSHADAA
jgi:hypothetical protein